MVFNHAVRWERLEDRLTIGRLHADMLDDFDEQDLHQILRAMVACGDPKALDVVRRMYLSDP